MISLAGSNSRAATQLDGGAPGGPGPNAPVVLVTPEANNAGARDDSPSMAAASSPSVTTTQAAPVAIPSPLEDLDALTVITRASKSLEQVHLLHLGPL